ncbi:MAG: RnfABCDGE type electron transport complex subunit D [Actinomycetota bacterium]|nr:RnfABCDGE type electron transport complex subunit D [Actinomycetota bacterium]
MEEKTAEKETEEKTTEKEKILISHAPHIWQGTSTGRIMYIVVTALLFPTGAAIYYFGYYAIYLILVSTITAVLTEFVIKKLRKKRFIMDGSAVITGLLLALTLPPRFPLWMAAIGSFFAIAVVKEAFGGLGYNIFNPALAGRAFLSVCFPAEMTSWVLPPHFNYDAITGATPLSENFIYQSDKIALYKDLFFGNRGGSLGETSVLLILVGALILILFRIIDWRIPVIYIATVALGSFIVGKDVLYQIMAGGLMLGAFFMATDYVTSPVTKNGRIIFGLGLGILTVLMRNFSNMPEGVCFSILIMNAFTPLIDRYVKVKPFGFVRKKKNV